MKLVGNPDAVEQEPFTGTDVVVWLFVSFDSRMRPGVVLSTKAVTECAPGTACHVFTPPGPEFALSSTDCPGPSGCALLSDQLTTLPSFVRSTLKLTPMITPAGVGAFPWFLTVAENRTLSPAQTVGNETLVTTRLGNGVPGGMFGPDTGGVVGGGGGGGSTGTQAAAITARKVATNASRRAPGLETTAAVAPIAGPPCAHCPCSVADLPAHHHAA